MLVDLSASVAIDPATYQVALSPRRYGRPSTLPSPESGYLTHSRIHRGQIAGCRNPDGMTYTPRYEAQRFQSPVG